MFNITNWTQKEWIYFIIGCVAIFVIIYFAMKSNKKENYVSIFGNVPVHMMNPTPPPFHKIIHKPIHKTMHKTMHKKYTVHQMDQILDSVPKTSMPVLELLQNANTMKYYSIYSYIFIELCNNTSIYEINNFIDTNTNLTLEDKNTFKDFVAGIKTKIHEMNNNFK